MSSKLADVKGFHAELGSKMTSAAPTGPGSEHVVAFTEPRDFLKQGAIPDSATTVLLGECTHGTNEFYELRAEISKFLIEQKKFSCILTESDWTFSWHINQYIHRKRSHMYPDKMRFPDWMWKNRPFYELVEWMRRRASSDGPFLFGLDCYCKDESKEECLNFFDFHDRDGLGKQFRQTIYPSERPDKWPDILSKLQWAIEKDKGRRGTSTGVYFYEVCLGRLVLVV